jgi:hypothetical protein
MNKLISIIIFFTFLFSISATNFSAKAGVYPTAVKINGEITNMKKSNCYKMRMCTGLISNSTKIETDIWFQIQVSNITNVTKDEYSPPHTNIENFPYTIGEKIWAEVLFENGTANTTNISGGWKIGDTIQGLFVLYDDESGKHQWIYLEKKSEMDYFQEIKPTPNYNYKNDIIIISITITIVSISYIIYRNKKYFSLNNQIKKR